MPFRLSIPTPTGEISIVFNAGESVILAGANGGGKTRLAVYAEKILGELTQRISAHRALALNPAVAKVREADALRALRFGDVHASLNINLRDDRRWLGKPATTLLNDFDKLIQALFADQSNTALKTHTRLRTGDHSPPPLTKFERLSEIWERLLPHRTLHITGDDIEVSIVGIEAKYSASEMSDGERAIFYMIGQALVAAADTVLIVDEPELHVHRSIMAKLWDEIEAARPDCGFFFITHDLEFAASRPAQKFVITDYDPAPSWTVEGVPENTGFSEELTTLILGSRRPILFVEGTEGSLDVPIYRSCFPDWTVVPKGSCVDVIHSVVTMRRNQALTRITCAGIVDADAHHPDEIAALRRHGIAVLPVSEIENLMLLPDVSRAIAASDGYKDRELEARLEALRAAVFQTLTPQIIERVVAGYCHRRIDRLLNVIDLSEAVAIPDIAAEFARETGRIDVVAIAEGARRKITKAIEERDLPSLLAIYDNKALLALAASHLKNQRRDIFEGWLSRIVLSDKAPDVKAAIQQALPRVEAR